MNTMQETVVRGRITRSVRIDPKQTPAQMIEILSSRGWTTQVDNDVLATITSQAIMAQGVVHFFPFNGFLLMENVAHEYSRHHLVPGPLSQLQVNIDDLLFAKDYPNGVQWVAGGKVCHMSFTYQGGRPNVYVLHRSLGWNDYWLLGGVHEGMSSNIIKGLLSLQS